MFDILCDFDECREDLIYVLTSHFVYDMPFRVRHAISYTTTFSGILIFIFLFVLLCGKEQTEYNRENMTNEDEVEQYLYSEFD